LPSSMISPTAEMRVLTISRGTGCGATATLAAGGVCTGGCSGSGEDGGAADSADDQLRTATPGQAIRAGSDLLVMGRPIVRAPDPAVAAAAVVAEIEASLGPPAA